MANICAKPGCDNSTFSFVHLKRGKEYCGLQCAYEDRPTKEGKWTTFHSFDEALARCPSHMKVLAGCALVGVATWAALR